MLYKYMLKSIERLDSLYHSISPKESGGIKKQKKVKLITEIVVGVNRLPLHKVKGYFNYSLRAFTEGNSFFMSFSRYDSQNDIFEKEFNEKYHSNLKLYLKALKEKYHS